MLAAQKTKTDEEFEFKAWVYAFLFMLGLSVTDIAAHLTGGPVFNTAFEICVFHIPTAILFIIVLYQKRRKPSTT